MFGRLQRHDFLLDKRGNCWDVVGVGIGYVRGRVGVEMRVCQRHDFLSDKRGNY